jgi:hypothetical protein
MSESLPQREPLLVRKWLARIAALAAGWVVATGKLGPDTGPVAQAATGLITSAIIEVGSDFWARAAVTPWFKRAGDIYDKFRHGPEGE